MVDKFLFFKTPMCPNCEEIQEWIDETPKVKELGEEVDATTKEGKERAKEYGVKGVPTIIFLKQGEKVATAESLDEFENIIYNKSLADY